MHRFGLLLFHVCLLQTVFACRSPFEYAPGAWATCGRDWHNGLAGPYGYGPFDFAGPYAGPFDFAGPFGAPLAELATGPVGAYGGAGVGELAVAGELPTGGATAVAGQVPILGAVEFAGPVKAAGTVTISGTCGCGCNSAFLY